MASFVCGSCGLEHDGTNLKAVIRLRDRGARPSIELETVDHPLALEQRNGISPARVDEIIRLMRQSGS